MPASWSTPVFPELSSHLALNCREVAERLRRPTWMPEQHCLWPAAFKGAAAELLRCLHRIDRQLADAAAGGLEGGRRLWCKG